MASHGLWFSAGLLALGGLFAGACASEVSVFGTSGGGQAAGGSASISSASAGGAGGTGCALDCTELDTEPCQLAVCNPATGECETVDAQDGTACDDGLFCTEGDSCLAGACVAGGPNDCDISAPQCNEVSCDESSRTCSAVPANDGGACQDANNLCLTGSVCNSGLCIGGTTTDCSLMPVPECQLAVCNPMTGMCEAQPGPNGVPCIDSMDLCTVDKSCLAGSCQGGMAKDCSQLDMGCVVGACNVNNGQCITQPATNGTPCDDSNACTSGETCSSSVCGNGTPVTQCLNGDGCCPMNCNANNDLDCACTTTLLQTSYNANNGNDGVMFDVVAVRNIEVLSFDVNLLAGSRTMQIYHRPGTHVGFESSSTGWTLLGSATVTSLGSNMPTAVPISVNVSITAGQTHAFYVTTTGGGLRYMTGTSLGAVYASNQDLQVLEGTAKAFPFSFSFAPRVFSGTVHYEHCGN